MSVGQCREGGKLRSLHCIRAGQGGGSYTWPQEVGGGGRGGAELPLKGLVSLMSLRSL